MWFLCESVSNDYSYLREHLHSSMLENDVEQDQVSVDWLVDLVSKFLLYLYQSV